MKRDRVMAVRFSANDIDALKAAAAAYRKKTGEMVTPSDLLRWGAAMFTEQVGIVMPGAVEN